MFNQFHPWTKLTTVIRHQFWVGSQSLKFQLSYKVDLHSQETSVVMIEILNTYGNYLSYVYHFNGITDTLSLSLEHRQLFVFGYLLK